jgi:hypothetical protein
MFGSKQFKYVPKAQRSKEDENKASKFATKLVKSDIDRVNSELTVDHAELLKGGCIYLPNFFCKTDDTSIFDKLVLDLENNSEFGMIKWSKHEKHENPDFSPTFNAIVKQMAEKFNVEVLVTRLNYYKDGNDWKPFHHDSHAYGEKQENFTMGASFGESRALEFLHEPSGNKFSFPQNNGDVFAFTTEINKKFMHGIPKSTAASGPRFSIIAWGQKIK